ncbi:MAG: prepilin-type N-terminal cleavage/methylation domain-containing protein [Deltaproteobacteria bacterium]|nr:prepilin-type N-terminal cleavage/methylation domain-containing protein [Deltaproteobacteria bacterium]
MRTDNTYTTKTGIRKSKKDEGFTLIEVLIAISIFAIGLLAVATMQLSAIRVNSTAGQITTRVTWAQDKLEKLMALPYSDHLLEDLGDPPLGTDTADNAHQETISEGSVNYTILWTVTDGSTDPGTPIPGTKLITVTVTGRGKTTRVSYIKPSMS